MSGDSRKSGSLFIVDNSVSGWTGLRYLEEWTGIARSFDIATGYFEIGALLGLEGQWQTLEKIRILMGAETTFRTRYAEFLKIDFPRLPLTSSLDLFRALSQLGGELVALHLMESPKLEQHLMTYTGSTGPVFDKVSWANNTVWLDKKQSCGFLSVPENVWNFHIGGYQVCHKWLKDRTLTADDLTHYHCIVVALSETIRLMAEIDVVIEQYGGWPGAFSS